MEFKDERQLNEANTRYGKDMLDNFNIDKDIVIWEIPLQDSINDYVVCFSHPEVIGRCPVSGYPDTYTIKVYFIPDKYTMELKSFKLWLNSYYAKSVSHEYLANEIFNIFKAKVQPKKLRVECLPAPRGNITTTIVVDSAKDGFHITYNGGII